VDARDGAQGCAPGPEEVDRAHRAHVALTLVPAIATKMDAMIERGHAHDDWSVIAKDFILQPR